VTLGQESELLRERTHHTGVVELHYAEGPPNGPPFVLLHGGSTRWQYGAALLEGLADRWHVFAPDLRGHGRSGRVPGRYALRDYAADIAAFLAQVVREPAIVYGHSLGGEIAVMVAAEQPALVRALIHGDAPLSTANHVTEEPAHAAMNQRWHTLAGCPVAEIAAALREMPVVAPGEASPRRAGDVFGEESPWFAFHATSLHLLDPDVLAAVLAGPAVMLAGYDPERLLPAIASPVLILRADPALSAMRDEDVALARRLLPQATVVQLDGVDHSLHGPSRQLERVRAAVMPFLEEMRAADTLRSSPIGPIG
jgi:pimeloyl-ACP methyl ester carboxylesterase